MENNVQTLLQEEKKVNAKVQQALAEKNEMLRGIKREANLALDAYRQTLEENHRRALIQVSGISPLNAFAEKTTNRGGIQPAKPGCELRRAGGTVPREQRPCGRPPHRKHHERRHRDPQSRQGTVQLRYPPASQTI